MKLWHFFDFAYNFCRLCISKRIKLIVSDIVFRLPECYNHDKVIKIFCLYLREDMREKSLQKIFPAFGTVNSITLYGGAGPGIAEHIKKP